MVKKTYEMAIFSALRMLSCRILRAKHANVSDNTRYEQINDALTEKSYPLVNRQSVKLMTVI